MTIPGWDLTETGGGSRDNEQYGADNGASSTGDTYSYGTFTAFGDRALGGLQASTLVPVFGASFTNATGASIAKLDVAYTGEMYRAGVLNRDAADRLDFQLSTDATSLSTGTWTDYDALDFSSPTINTTVGAKDGNARGSGRRSPSRSRDLRSPTARPSGSAGMTSTSQGPMTGSRSTTSRSLRARATTSRRR